MVVCVLWLFVVCAAFCLYGLYFVVARGLWFAVGVAFSLLLFVGCRCLGFVVVCGLLLFMVGCCLCLVAVAFLCEVCVVCGTRVRGLLLFVGCCRLWFVVVCRVLLFVG